MAHNNSLPSTDLRIVSVGMSHETAPMAVREAIASINMEWPRVLPAHLPGLREWAVLMTCHRFELYMVLDYHSASEAQRSLLGLIGDVTGLDSLTLATSLVCRVDQEVTEHLCRVAAGLDSVVLGEAQILGQVSEMFAAAQTSGTLGPVLTSVIRTAVRTGKRARTETSIGARAASMSSVALNMVEAARGELHKANVLVIGAGEMSRLALRALHARRISAVTIANRTIARAESQRFDSQWRVVELRQLPDVLAEADVVISATSAPHYILHADQIAQLMAQRGNGLPHGTYANGSSANGSPVNGLSAHGVSADRYGSLTLVDLALPRDIDPAAKHVPGITLIDVDDLQESVEETLTLRTQALPVVESILHEELARWQAEQRELALRPLVAELRQQAERIRQQEVERTLRFLGSVDEETARHINHLSRALVNKLLHEPTVRIREMAHTEQAAMYAETVRDIFGLQVSLEQAENDDAITSD